MTFESTFQGCKGIELIPEILFWYNRNVTTFKSTFKDCTSIKDIPKRLFVTNCNVTTFESTFSNCAALTRICVLLFETNINVENFKETFSFCKELYLIFHKEKEKELNLKLFQTNKKAYNFESTFESCIQLQFFKNVMNMGDVITFATLTEKEKENFSMKNMFYRVFDNYGLKHLVDDLMKAKDPDNPEEVQKAIDNFKNLYNKGSLNDMFYVSYPSRDQNDLHVLATYPMLGIVSKP
jgi:hypothetical protein